MANFADKELLNATQNYKF